MNSTILFVIQQRIVPEAKQVMELSKKKKACETKKSRNMLF
ncbi:hypothetical protein RV17_GL001892 [Enterococcus thailandicus]|nr:hypothetical protein RV17_GL001892 [Enterococcus thailandicus]